MTGKSNLLRFSLRSLLLAVAFTGFVCGTIMSGSTSVEWTINVLAMSMLTVAPVLAAYTRGRTQVFWMGFFAFGFWLYILMYTRARNNDVPARALRSRSRLGE